MDQSVILAILSSLGVGLILRQVVTHLLSRGKVRFEEAALIRSELYAQMEKKDKEIKELGARVTHLEAELQKSEDDRAGVQNRHENYKVKVYRTLIDSSADKALLDAVLALE